MGGLAADRVQIGNSVANLSSLAQALADLITQGRPAVKADVAELRQLSKLLVQPNNDKIINRILDRLPEMLEDQTRTGTYGSWYNYYLCGASVNITLPDGLNVPGLNQLTDQLKHFDFHSRAARCNL